MATEKQLTEAKSRMAKLVDKYELNKNLNKYLAEGKVYYSYIVSGMFGCIDNIDYDERYVDVCRDFEKRTNAYVYHAIETNTMFGKMLALLFVSDDKNEEEWSVERPQKNFVQAYVYNLDEEFGEFGDICLASDNGALIRTS